MPELTATQKEELAVTYAALILHDDGIEITGDKIAAILKAANVRVQPYLPRLYARVLAKVNVDDLILGAGSGGAAAAPAAAAPAAGAAAAAPAAAAPAEDKKKDKSESEDEDMGFGLFD